MGRQAGMLWFQSAGSQGAAVMIIALITLSFIDTCFASSKVFICLKLLVSRTLFNINRTHLTSWLWGGIAKPLLFNLPDTENTALLHQKKSHCNEKWFKSLQFSTNTVNAEIRPKEGISFPIPSSVSSPKLKLARSLWLSLSYVILGWLSLGDRSEQDTPNTI